MRWTLFFLFCLHYPLWSEGLATNAKRRPRRGATTSGSTGGGFGATQTKTYATDESPQIARLMEFLESQKAEINNVEVGIDASTGMRGLYATKNFGSKSGGQVLCRIPSDCALALGDPSAGGDDAPTPAHRGLNFLNMYWKNEAKRSQWAPYLDTLPTRVEDATPDLFSDEEVELLEFPRAIREARERKQQIADLAAANSGAASLEELQFATWIDSSRAFELAFATKDDEDDGDADGSGFMSDEHGRVISKAKRKGLHVLVPLLDMVNHHCRPNAKLTLVDPEKDEAWFALKTLRPIPSGKEICIAYGWGAASSLDLLLDAGFVPAEKNQLDGILLKRGGEGVIEKLSEWSTTLEEDRAMLGMTGDEDAHLKKILQFRIKLKEAYPKDS